MTFICDITIVPVITYISNNKDIFAPNTNKILDFSKLWLWVMFYRTELFYFEQHTTFEFIQVIIPEHSFVISQ